MAWGLTDLVSAGHSHCRLPFPQSAKSDSAASELRVHRTVDVALAPRPQRVPPSQSLDTVHFARRFQSTPWVTGGTGACWHLFLTAE